MWSMFEMLSGAPAMLGAPPLLFVPSLFAGTTRTYCVISATRQAYHLPVNVSQRCQSSGIRCPCHDAIAFAHLVVHCCALQLKFLSLFGRGQDWVQILTFACLNQVFRPR